MSRELKSGFFFLALSMLILWESRRVELGTFVEPGSGFLTFGTGLALCVLSIVMVCRGWKVREAHKPFSRRVALALASLFTYSLVLSYLGFLVATFFLVAVLFHLGKPRKWWFLLGMSALVSLAAYLVFGVLLHVYFPRGFLGI
jgi:hypothetical protein